METWLHFGVVAVLRRLHSSRGIPATDRGMEDCWSAVLCTVPDHYICTTCGPVGCSMIVTKLTSKIDMVHAECAQLGMSVRLT